MKPCSRVARVSCVLALALAVPIAGTASPAGGSAAGASSMTAERQKALTPAAVLAELKEGNRRFVEGRLTPRDYKAEVAATAKGQYPKAVLLSCLDSRVPPEIVFDQGIGDLFVGRVAGNVEDTNLVGSMEFATKAAGAKLIVVLGHSSCGALKGAVDGVQLGNLTALLKEFDGAVADARRDATGATTSSDAAFIQAVAEENVRHTMRDIVSRSPVIAELVKSGQVAIAGGVYDLATGKVSWLQ